MIAIASNLVFSAPTETSLSTTTDPNLLLSSKSCNYPLTSPVVLSDGYEYRIAMVSDLDADSKTKDEPYTWHSYFKKGTLSYHRGNKTVCISWDSTTSTQTFSTHFSENGRGLELSELVTYYCNLVTFDDKTGMVYVVDDQNVSPWIFLAEGDGVHSVTKGNTLFKDYLYSFKYYYIIYIVL